MFGSSIETPEDRNVREQREIAERAVAILVDALALAGLPPLPGLDAYRIRVTPVGVHVEIGGCNVWALQALAHHVSDHTRCLGRILPGHILPSLALPAGLAELPGVRDELSER